MRKTRPVFHEFLHAALLTCTKLPPKRKILFRVKNGPSAWSRRTRFAILPLNEEDGDSLPRKVAWGFGNMYKAKCMEKLLISYLKGLGRPFRCFTLELGKQGQFAMKFCNMPHAKKEILISDEGAGHW